MNKPKLSTAELQKLLEARDKKRKRALAWYHAHKKLTGRPPGRPKKAKV